MSPPGTSRPRRVAATLEEVRRYFESDCDAVSSPLSAFGVLTPYGQEFLRRFDHCLRDRIILDAGAGRGVVAVEVAHAHSAFVIALDFSDWVREIPPEAHPIKGELSRLPLPDGAIDTVICLEVLEHTINPDQVIAELWRVLRPGGSLILSTPSYLNMAGLLKICLEACGLYEKDTFAPFDAWKPKVLERGMIATRVHHMLRKQGFAVSKVEGAEIFDAWLPFANRIPGLFENRSFLRLRETIDRASSWPLIKWLSLHGVFHAVRPFDRAEDRDLTRSA